MSLLVPYGGPALAAGDKPPEPDIRVLLDAGLGHLDPHHQVSRQGRMLLRNVFETLVVETEEGELKPNLVDQWNLVDDRHLRIHVRSGIRFHDGSLLTATHVQENLDRIRDSPESSLARWLAPVESVEPLGEGWLEIEAEAPVAQVLRDLVGIPVAKLSDDADAPAIGTGPYLVDDWQPGKRFVVRSFGQYWQYDVPAKTVAYLTEPENSERVRQLIEGAADLVFPVDPSSVPEIESKSGLWVESTVSHRVRFLALRADGPLADPRLRKAINLAINRQEVVEFLQNYAHPANQMVGPLTVGFVPELAATERDLVTARSLVSQLNLPEDFRLEVELSPASRDLGGLLQKHLREVGILIEQVELPWVELEQRLMSGKPMAFLGAFTHGGGDPAELFASLVHSPSHGLGEAHSFGATSPEFDAHIREAIGTDEAESRNSRFQALVRRVADDGYFLPIVWPLDLYGQRRDLIWVPRSDGFVLAQDLSFQVDPVTPEAADPGAE